MTINRAGRPERLIAEYSSASATTFAPVYRQGRTAPYRLQGPVTTEPSVSTIWLVGKRCVDFLASVTLLILLSPVFLIIAGLVAVTGFPILFCQQRIGRDGKMFLCFKFRTMVRNAEQRLEELLEKYPELRSEWERTQKLRDDPRETAVGRWLRKTCLDELPQLLNVLRGDMSLIGPRPILKDELARYGKAARWYLAVRPGISGMWQVNGYEDPSYRRRVALDLYYVRNQSPWLDLQIALKTLVVVLRRSGGGR